MDSRGQNAYPVQLAGTPTTANSDGIDQDGTDYSYFIQAGVGSAQKPMYLLLDSGAGTTWVMGSSCQSDACNMHTSYGPSDSTSYKALSKPFFIDYGSGSVGGMLIQDSLTVAGIKSWMTFGVANTTTSDFVRFPFDGVLGLSMNIGTTDNFFKVLKQDKALNSNIFSLWLNRHSDGPNEGQITFGATDPSKFTGSISYTTVEPAAAGDWAIPLGDFAYNGKTAGIKGRLAYIDSGTTFVFGPPSDVAAVHKLIPGSTSSDGGVTYSVPCDSTAPVTVTFSGVSYSISPQDWIARNGAGCTSTIFGHEVVTGAWLLGDVFLKNVYSVFDVDETRIGFASKKASSVATSSQTSSTTSGPPSGILTSSAMTTGATTTTMTGPVTPGFSGPSSSSTSRTTGANGTSRPMATPSGLSSGGQLERNNNALIICIVAVIVMAV